MIAERCVLKKHPALPGRPRLPSDSPRCQNRLEARFQHGLRLSHQLTVPEQPGRARRIVSGKPAAGLHDELARGRHARSANDVRQAGIRSGCGTVSEQPRTRRACK